MYIIDKELVFGSSLRATQLDTDQVGIEWLPLHNITHYRLYPQTLCAQLQKHFIHHEKTEVYLGDVN